MAKSNVYAPWSVSETQGECQEGDILDANGRQIFCAMGINHGLTEAEILSMSRVAAAAPELLELVKQFERVVDYEIDKASANGDTEAAACRTLTANLISDAIAKAEGRL